MATIQKGQILREDFNLWDGITKTDTRIDATGGTITGNKIGDAVDVLMVYGGGTSYTSTTINDAVAALSTNAVDLLFSPGTWNITTNVTIPSTMNCIVPAGCIFNISSGITLTMNGQVYSSNATINSGLGSLSYGLEISNPEFYNITAAEIAAAITPTNYLYKPGNVKRYGALGDGSNNDTTAIQNANDYIVQTGKPNDLIIPPGTYKCTSKITFDVSVVTILGEGAILDFSTLSTGAAIELNGGTYTYSGAPYYNGINILRGLNIIGPGNGVANTIGVHFTDGDTAGPNDICLRDCVISAFEKGIVLGDNSYHLSFDHISIFVCSTCVQAQLFSNAGARTVFTHSKFFNSAIAFDLQNASSGSTSIMGCVIAGISTTCIQISGGSLQVSGCDFEPGSSHGSSYRTLFVTNDSPGSYSYINWTGNLVSHKNPVAVAPFTFEGKAHLTIEGGYIYANPAITTYGVFDDTSGGAPGGNITLLGPWIDKGSNNLTNLSTMTINSLLIPSLLSEIDTNLSFASGKGVNFGLAGGNVMDYYDDSITFSPTIVSGGGAVSHLTQTGLAVRIGNRIFFDIYINFNIGTATGNLSIGLDTLPSQVSGGKSFHAIGYTRGFVFPANKVTLFGYKYSGAADMKLKWEDSTGVGVTDVAATDITAASGTPEVAISGSYTVA